MKQPVYAPVHSTSPYEENMTSGSALLPVVPPDANGVTEQADLADYIATENIPAMKFITETFKKRTCKRFVPRENSPRFCYCGYTEAGHTDEAKVKADTSRPWNSMKDTELSATDAFGEVQFVISGQKICKYIRVDVQTSFKDLKPLMLDYWQMEKPNLLISVTGGAQNFRMKPRLKEVFRQGLVKAAESTRAWIITGGTNAGVMKHVGEALRDYTIKYGTKKQLVALGIATWGCIENREDLVGETVGEQNVGCWPASYKITESSSEKKKVSPLDPNHTHFILVDNGTQQSFGVEIELRAKLESEISKMQTTEQTVLIPVVCVVLEGGPNTLETVKKAIEAGTPAIIVAGSGRAADILAYAYERCKECEEELDGESKEKVTFALYEDCLWDEVEELVKKEFNKKEDRDIKKCVDDVRACINKIDHLTVFRLDGGSSAKDIDVTILRALLKVNRGKRLNQLRLALAWDRVDVAKDEIFTDGVNFEESELNDLMYSAIVNNRVDFVKLFLDKGLSLREFLSFSRINDLYNHPVMAENCRQLKRKKKKNLPISLRTVGELIKELSGELFEPLYCTKEFQKTTENQQQQTSKKRKTSVAVALKEINPLPKDTICPFDEPGRELFLWSILTQRREMAMAFWFEAKEDLALAVIAHLLLKSLLEKDPEPELNQKLSEQVAYYEELAIGLLNECHSSDQSKAIQLLVREIRAFGDTTVLRMAVQADNKNFIAHPACQSLLTEVWTGKLSDDNHYLMLLGTSFCPLLAPVLLKYREKERKQTNGRPSHSRPSTATADSRSPGASDSNVRASQAELLNGPVTSKTFVDSAEKSENISFFEKIGFFFQAPVIKFCYSCMTYFAFLLLYGIILLTDFYPTISIKEEILIAWVITLIFEEIRQVVMDEAGDVRLKLYNYITDIWNVMDVITIVTFLAGMILRFIPVSICADCFFAARIVLALNFMTFFFRILHMFSIHRELGPKLVMIGKMMIDLFYFMIILLVFIAAYGIASHVILYPNQPLNIVLARDVLSRSWWNIFGELGLDEISGESCNDTQLSMPMAEQCASMDYDEFSSNECGSYKSEKCPSIDWLVPIILGIYALVTNVLMLNLLIAMFSNTFSNIQGQTNVVWKMQRYHLVREYESRPMLPPPFIILAHIFLLFRYIIRHYCGCRGCSGDDNSRCCRKDESKFRLKFKQLADEKDLLYWENVNSEEFLRKREADEREAADNKARDTSDRIDQILKMVEEIAETNFLLHSQASDEVQPQLPPALEKRFEYLEKQMQRTSKAIDWLIAHMTSSKDQFTLPDVDDELKNAKERRDLDEKRKKEEAKEEMMKRMKIQRQSHDSVYAKQSSANQSTGRTHSPQDDSVKVDIHAEHKSNSNTDGAAM